MGYANDRFILESFVVFEEREKSWCGIGKGGMKPGSRVILRDLPGTSKDVGGRVFWTPRQAEALLRRGLAATAAGPDGAINIWRDSEGKLRGHLMDYREVLEEKTFKSPSEAGLLCGRWLAAIGLKGSNDV
jgi:hypothetical protein